jgi:hypothetical protein
MSFKLSKTIKRPSDNQEVEFDGKLPKQFDFISSGRLEFTPEDVGKAFHSGEIDDVTRDFLWNVLTEASVDAVTSASVVRDCRLYMARLLGGMKPGQDLFIRVQELGLKHHIGTMRDGKPVDLDISKYTVPEVQLAGAIIAGSFTMEQTTVVNDVRLDQAVIGGDVDQWRAVIGGNVDQREVEISHDAVQCKAKIGGDVYQSRAKIGGDVDQSKARIGGDVDQGRAKIGGDVDQVGTEIRGKIIDAAGNTIKEADTDKGDENE